MGLYTASIFGVVIMRIRQPHVTRPFRVFIGVPIVMSLVSTTLVIIPFFRTPYFSLALFGFIIAGIPVYYICIYSQPKYPVMLVDYITNKLQAKYGMVPCRAEHCG